MWPWESAFKIPMSQIFSPRSFLLTAKKLVTTMNQMTGWWQYRPEGLLRGWEIGGQSELQEERKIRLDEIRPRQRTRR